MLYTDKEIDELLDALPCRELKAKHIEVEGQSELQSIVGYYEGGGWFTVAKFSSFEGAPFDKPLADLCAAAPELVRQQQALLKSIRTKFPWHRGDEGCPDVPVLQPRYDALRDEVRQLREENAELKRLCRQALREIPQSRDTQALRHWTGKRLHELGVVEE